MVPDQQNLRKTTKNLNLLVLMTSKNSEGSYWLIGPWEIWVNFLSNFQSNFNDWWLKVISCEIALWWMSLYLIDDKSTLVQVMAWCRQATSHYLSQCWPRSMTLYGITRPQWVKDYIEDQQVLLRTTKFTTQQMKLKFGNVWSPLIASFSLSLVFAAHAHVTLLASCCSWGKKVSIDKSPPGGNWGEGRRNQGTKPAKDWNKAPSVMAELMSFSPPTREGELHHRTRLVCQCRPKHI